VYFTLAPALIKELWDEYQISEDLVRFVTMRIEEDEVLEKLEFKTLAE
jgi:small subunit ribosomal protein S6